MSFDQIRSLTLKLYGPALYLEGVLPLHVRMMLKRIATVVIVILMALYAFGWLAVSVGGSVESSSRIIVALAPQILGLLTLAIAFRLCIMALDFFSHSFLFQDLDHVLEVHDAMPMITVEASHAIAAAEEGDPLSGLLRSEVGLESLFRVGISPEEASLFNPPPAAVGGAYTFSLDTPLSLTHYAATVYKDTKTFSDFLFQHGVQEADFIGAVAWVEEMRRDERRRARWWSKDMLGRVPGIGKDWSYGQIYYLEKYAHDMLYHPVYRSMTAASSLGKQEVEAIETILCRAREANALLVGEAGSGVMEIIARLTREIQEGHILPPLEGKRVFVVNGETLIAVAKEKGLFEAEFMQMMSQSIAAGNIILVFENLPNFMKSADTLGVNVVELLEPYLSSPGVQIIATADPGAFHGVLEKNGMLMQAFEVVQLREAESGAILDAIKRHARSLERRYGVFFTYQSVLEIIDAAEQFMPYGVMPDKAIDLLTEIVPAMTARKKVLIEKKDVEAYVSTKTGVPVGDVGGGERAALMDLEKTLESRIIGQSEAVKAIASAMRRARAGVKSGKRPLGTFLFLGPTGVGKTETAKVLAELFFKKGDAMIRIEMPEYRGPDALDRLIGTFEGGKPGILTSALKERPYGVLLLNEFEKTTDQVLDLFLTILDEGQFSDAAGKKVDARNVIMIATSNAGADLVWEYFKNNQNPAEHKDELVDAIIKKGIYKPELVNRFDGVIVFNPLSLESTKQIAKLNLEGLAKRLRDKGIEYVVTEPAINAVVKAGYRPEFGARAMARAVTEKVEQILADRMIAGTVKPGMKVELTEADFPV